MSSILILSGIAQEIKKPGNGLRLEDAAQSAEGICIAQFESLGTPDIGSLGSTYYSNAVLRVSRTLASGKSKILDCAYSVQTIPESAKEEAPTVAESFLILGNFTGKTFKVTKLVEPTEANVGVVEQVLRTRGIEVSPATKTSSTENDQDDAKHQPAELAVKQAVNAAPKPAEAMPATSLSEEPTSSIPWSIIVVLIVAAIGLLWLLLNRRS